MSVRGLCGEEGRREMSRITSAIVTCGAVGATAWACNGMEADALAESSPPALPVDAAGVPAISVDSVLEVEVQSLFRLRGWDEGANQEAALQWVKDAAYDGRDKVAIVDQGSGRVLLLKGVTSSEERMVGPHPLSELSNVPVTYGVPGSVEFLGGGDSELVVIDVGRWRVMHFDTDGKWTDTRSIPSQPRFGQPFEVKASRVGDLFQLGYSHFQSSLQQALGTRPSGVATGTTMLQRLEGNRWQDVRAVPGLEVFVDQVDGRIQSLPYAAKVAWAPAGDAGVWLTFTRSDFVARLTPKGALQCVARFDGHPAPTSKGEKDAFYAAVDVEDPLRRASVREDRRALPFPSHLPRFQAVVTGGDEGAFAIWQGLAGGERAARALHLSEQCEIEFQVRLPEGVRVVRGGRGWLLGVETHDSAPRGVVLFRW